MVRPGSESLTASTSHGRPRASTKLPCSILSFKISPQDCGIAPLFRADLPIQRQVLSFREG